jgi:predicted amidohydrolase YtcJ
LTRTLLRGGRVFDGTGAPPAEADLVVEDGRILDVGPGLDGDEAVEVGGRYLLPGLFDCHTHVTITNVNLLGMLQTPFSYRFFETVQNLAATLRVGITRPGTRPGPTPGSSRPWPTGSSPGRGCRSR